MTNLDKTTQTIFYDIFNYEVVRIQIISEIENGYFLALNLDTQTPIKVWNGRINELFVSELDAQTALRDLLFAKLQIVADDIVRLTPIKSTD